MNKPIFVKLGGSVLTDKNAPESLATTTLHTVAQTIAAHRREQPETVLLVGHGGGSFGHYWAEKYRTADGIIHAESWWGVALVADAMARLNRAVVGALLEAEIPAVGIQPMAAALAAGGQIQRIGHEQIALLLHNGVIPVIYGDVLLDTEQGCTIASTESLFAALVPYLQPTRMILVGEEAVFDRDPRHDPNARAIRLIDRRNYADALAHLGGSHGVDVTGGMRAKVAAMWQLAATAPDLEIVICGPNDLAAALRGESLASGTIIANTELFNHEERLLLNEDALN